MALTDSPSDKSTQTDSLSDELMLKNRTIEKLTAEGKVSYLSREEAYEIRKSTYERMKEFSRREIRREFEAEQEAKKIILKA